MNQCLDLMIKEIPYQVGNDGLHALVGLVTNILLLILFIVLVASLYDKQTTPTKTRRTLDVVEQK